jgi:hypothetical protein
MTGRRRARELKERFCYGALVEQCLLHDRCPRQDECETAGACIDEATERDSHAE